MDFQKPKTAQEVNQIKLQFVAAMLDNASNFLQKIYPMGTLAFSESEKKEIGCIVDAMQSLQAYAALLPGSDNCSCS